MDDTDNDAAITRAVTLDMAQSLEREDARTDAAAMLRALVRDNGRLRAELAALREPAGDALVEAAVEAIKATQSPGSMWLPSPPTIARAVLDAVLPRVRAEGWREDSDTTPAGAVNALKAELEEATLARGRLRLWLEFIHHNCTSPEAREYAGEALIGNHVPEGVDWDERSGR